MKEKTFEELIEPLRQKYIFDNGVDLGVVYEEDVSYLLKQVREATIAECEEIAFNNLDFLSCECVRNGLYKLPTDRIILKTT